MKDNDVNGLIAGAKATMQKRHDSLGVGGYGRSATKEMAMYLEAFEAAEKRIAKLEREAFDKLGIRDTLALNFIQTFNLVAENDASAAMIQALELAEIYLQVRRQFTAGRHAAPGVEL